MPTDRRPPDGHDLPQRGDSSGSGPEGARSSPLGLGGRPAPCIGCGRDTAPRQVYCNRCRKALRLEGSSQRRRYGLRMMDSPEADLPRMSDELREAVREAEAVKVAGIVHRPGCAKPDVRATCRCGQNRACRTCGWGSLTYPCKCMKAAKGTEAECKPTK